MSILTDTIRKQFKEGDDIRDEGLTTPDTVQRFDNILYGRSFFTILIFLTILN